MFEKRTSINDKVFDITILVVLSIVFLFAAYPLYFVLIASISDPEFVNRGEVLLYPKGFNIESYKLVLKDPRILTGYRNTIIYTFFGTILSVLVTICAAFPLSRKDLYGKKIFLWFFLFTMYFHGGLIPTYLQIQKLGLINTPWVMIVFGSLSIWNLIISRTYFTTNIPEELNEAAQIDGCSTIKFFFKIVIPNSKAIIAIITLYSAVVHWNDFFKALIYLNKSALYPLQLILRDILLASQALMIEADPELLNEMTRQSESMKFSMIIVASVPVLLLYPIAQKYFVRGVMVGSVKG